MNELTLVELIVLALGCFRITHLFVYDVITAPLRWIFIEEVEEPDASGRMNRFVYPRLPMWKAFFGMLISCPWCFGFWVAVALVAGWYFFPTVTFIIALIFALSGVAGFLETLIKLWGGQMYMPTKAQLDRMEEMKEQFMNTGQAKSSELIDSK